MRVGLLKPVSTAGLCFLFVVIITVSYPAGAQSHSDEQAAEYRRISASQAFLMMTQTPAVIVLDVRTRDEFITRRIDGAILIPHNQISQRAEQELPDKNSMILIYCQGGVRSEQAARTLINLGYTNIFDFGGINDWWYSTVSGR